LKFEERRIKTIGFYYPIFQGNGIERVITQLSSLLAEVRDEDGNPKYRIVLISDDAPNEEAYPVSPLVIREQLPPYQESIEEKYTSRALKWQEIIATHEIDAFLYSHWLNPYMIWDFLSIKRSEGHPAFVLHTHNTYTQANGLKEISENEIQHIYGMADGVVTLSDLLMTSGYEGFPPSLFEAAVHGMRTVLPEEIEYLIDRRPSGLTDESNQACDEIGRLETELRNRKAELDATRNSLSFRLGRTITWLPRKLRGGVRCWREHGGKYTFRRMLYHLHLKPNNDKSD
jgi:hypothetical protein